MGGKVVVVTGYVIPVWTFGQMRQSDYIFDLCSKIKGKIISHRDSFCLFGSFPFFLFLVLVWFGMFFSANSGLGKELATYAAAKGAKLYMLCRSKERAEKARDEIVSKTSNENVKILLVSLG